MPSSEWTFSLYLYFRETVCLQTSAIRFPHVCVNKSVTNSTYFGEPVTGRLGLSLDQKVNLSQRRSAQWGEQSYGGNFLTDERQSALKVVSHVLLPLIQKRVYF